MDLLLGQLIIALSHFLFLDEMKQCLVLIGKNKIKLNANLLI